MDFLVLGFFAALALFILFYKMGLKHFVRFHILVDIVGGMVFYAAYVGSFSGMSTAVAAAIWFSIMMSFTRYFVKPAQYNLSNPLKRKSA